MKTSNFIARILLLAVMVSPFGQRAFGVRMNLSSCHVHKLQAVARHPKGRTTAGMHRLGVSSLGHRGSTQRFHRGRGNRIYVETGLVETPSLSTIHRVPFSNTAISHQELDGPNPSRGPPSQLSL